MFSVPSSISGIEPIDGSVSRWCTVSKKRTSRAPSNSYALLGSMVTPSIHTSITREAAKEEEPLAEA